MRGKYLQTLAGVLLFVILTSTAHSAIYTVASDDFNDGVINPDIWDVLTFGGFQAVESQGVLFLGGTSTTSQSVFARANVKQLAGQPAPFEVSFLMKASVTDVSGCDARGELRIPGVMAFGWGGSPKVLARFGLEQEYPLFHVLDDGPIGDWHTYFLKYDGTSKVDFVIDGVQKSSTSITFPQPATGFQLSCFADPFSFNDSCSGQVVNCEIDDFKVIIDDTVPPVINGLSPADGSKFTNTNQLQISANISDEFRSGIDESSIQLKVDGQIALHIFSLTGSGSVIVSIPQPLTFSDGKHTVFLTVQDRVGNQATATWSFVVDIGGPIITNENLLPPDGGTDDSTPLISARLFDPSGFDTGSIVLKLDGNVVTHTFTPEPGDPTTATVSFQVPNTQPLSGGAHTVTLTAKDILGRETTKTWSFTVVLQLTEAHLTNVTRPGATDIAIGEQYKLRALGDPGQTVTGILANFDRIPPQPGQRPVLAVFLMPEVSAGVYESVQTLTTFTDADGFTATKVVGAVTNAPPEREDVEPMVTPEVLTVIAVQITSVTLSNATRPGATDVGPGEFLKVIAEGVNLTTAEVVLLDADHINEPFALVQGPATMFPASPQLQALLRLENLTNQAGNAITAITAKVSVPGTGITALSVVPLAVVPDTTPPTITTTINGAPTQALYNPTDAPLNVVVTTTDDSDVCPKLDTPTVTRNGAPFSLTWTCTANPGPPPCPPARSSTCTTSLGQSGDYVITSTAKDQAAPPNMATQTVTFTLAGPPQDNAAPVIRNLTPPDLSTVTTAVVIISADLQDNPPTGAGLDPASIVMQVDGTAVAATFTPDPTDPLRKGTVSFTSPLGCGPHTVSLTACDKAMPPNCKTATWSFTVSGTADTTPPTVSSASPPDGSTVSACPVTISATLLDNGGGSGVDPAMVAMTLDGTAVTPSYNMTTGLVSFTPATLLFGSHTVTLTATDRCANSITPPVSWSFNIVDNIAPIVVILSPSEGSQTPDTTPTITFTVSDAFCTSNIASITLTAGGNSYTIPAATGTINFDVPDPLPSGSNTLAITVTDNAGNATTVNSSFQVIGPTTAPIIYSVFRVVEGPKLVAPIFEPPFCFGDYIAAFGRNLQPGMTGRLKKAGQTDIACLNMFVFPGGGLDQSTATDDAICFIKTGEVIPGKWDLEISNPDGQSITMPQSVEIKPNVVRACGVTPALLSAVGSEPAPVTMTFTGVNFKSGMQIKAIDTLNPTLEIPCTDLTVVSPTQASCNFIISPKTAQGSYSLQTINPDNGVVFTGPPGLSVRHVVIDFIGVSGHIGTTALKQGQTARFYTCLAYGGPTVLIKGFDPQHFGLEIFLPAGVTFWDAERTFSDRFFTSPKGIYNPTTNSVRFFPAPAGFYWVEFTVDAPVSTSIPFRADLFVTLPAQLEQVLDTVVVNRTVVSPLDPSEVLPFPEHFVSSEEMLHYVIRVVNTTEHVIRRVFIKDILDPKLDDASLLLVDGLSTYDPETRTITWDMGNLNLQPGKEDFVFFIISPKSGLKSGTLIQNKATLTLIGDMPPLAQEAPTVENVIAPAPAVELELLLSVLHLLEMKIRELNANNSQGYLAKVQNATTNVQLALNAILEGDNETAKQNINAASGEMKALSNLVSAQTGKQIATEQGTDFQDLIGFIIKTLSEQLLAVKSLAKTQTQTSQQPKDTGSLQLGDVKNFPNPSKNPHTKFYYKPSSGTVASASIEIYTLSGKLMVKIVDPTPADGEYVWDIPKSVANGVYLYRVTISDGQTTLTRSGKMVLLR